MRTLAIDFGERRVGLAISDPSGRVALPLATLSRTSDRQLIQELVALIEDENVEFLVVGEPRRLDGTRGDAALRVASFANKLARVTGLPCRLVDESLTSYQAEERLRASGLDPREHPDKIDALAAQILLSDALDTHPEGTS